MIWKRKSSQCDKYLPNIRAAPCFLHSLTGVSNNGGLWHRLNKPSLLRDRRYERSRPSISPPAHFISQTTERISISMYKTVWNVSSGGLTFVHMPTTYHPLYAIFSLPAKCPAESGTSSYSTSIQRFLSWNCSPQSGRHCCCIAIDKAGRRAVLGLT